MAQKQDHIFVLLLVLSLSVSCSRIGAPSDDAIATDIKAKMFSEPVLKSAAVDVSSKGGEVTLTGQVPDDAARLAAYKIATQARALPGKRSDERRYGASGCGAGCAVYAPAPLPAAKPARKPKPAAKPMREAEAARASQPAAPAEMAAPAPSASAATRDSDRPANSIVTIRTIDGIDSKHESCRRSLQGFAGCADCGG